MGGQLKRRRPPHLLRPDQMLATLASLRLHALLQHGGVWLALPPEGAEVLNQCCTGQMDGGPGTAEEVAAVLAPLVGEPLLLPPVQPPVPLGTAGQGQPGAGAGAAQGPEAAAVQQADTEAQPQPRPQPAEQGPAQAQQRAQLGSGGKEAMEVDRTPQGSEKAAKAEAAEVGLGLGAARGSGPGEGAGLPDAAADAPGGRPLTEPSACTGPAQPVASPSAGCDGGDGSEAPGVSGAVPEASVAAAAATERNNGGLAAAAAAASATQAAAAGGGAASAARPAPGDGSGPGRPRRGGGGRGAGPPPFAPAAAGCRLVAVRLTPEETFFLHHVLRCLQVYELQPGSPLPASPEHVRLLDTEGLWRACRQIRSNFVTSYAAYHHLKAKGWIPRSGLLYGVDYVVYQLHPVGCHSEYGVLVVPVGVGGGPAGPHTPPLSWLDLQITNRLVNQVVKKLILLYLYERPGPDHDTPACLANFAVEERIVRRWVPDATRD